MNGYSFCLKKVNIFIQNNLSLNIYQINRIAVMNNTKNKNRMCYNKITAGRVMKNFFNLKIQSRIQT